MKLITDGNRGIYAPQQFVQNYGLGINYTAGCDPLDISIVAEGPDHEDYWEAWDNIKTHFYDEGKYIYEDGDIFVTTEVEYAAWQKENGMESEMYF